MQYPTGVCAVVDVCVEFIYKPVKLNNTFSLFVVQLFKIYYVVQY